MRRLLVPLAALTLVAACSSESTDSSPEPSGPPTPPARVTPSEASTPSEPGTTEQPSTKPDNALTLTVADQARALVPTDVYCSGKPGSIRRAAGKNDNRPPIIVVDGDRFAMVKTGGGPPYRAEQPQGVSYEEAVVFDSVEFAGGDVTLDGTMACTTFEGR